MRKITGHPYISDVIHNRNTNPLLKDFFNKKIKPNTILYIFMIPAIIYTLVFSYYPMYGLVIAFKRFNAGLGITGSPWVGLMWFEKFFDSSIFWVLLKNTMGLSLYTFIAGMPIPIILSLAFHYCSSNRFKKLVQTVTYAPHFISVVVLVGMIMIFLSPRSGIVNLIITALGGQPVHFMMDEKWFSHLYVWSGIWHNVGWNTIIYMAVLSGSSVELHEAAIVDGASKFRRAWHIDLPVIAPTFIILQIMALGNIMSVGFEKVYLMQNSGNAMVSEIISTYVYKMGIQGGNFSYTTAIGLFNNLVNLGLLFLANWMASRISKLSVI